MIRTLVSWDLYSGPTILSGDLYWGPPILGNYNMG